MKKTTLILISIGLVLMIGCWEEPIDSMNIEEITFESKLKISLPDTETIFEPGYPVQFEAIIKTISYDITELTATWRSNKDGLLHTSNPDISGDIAFYTSDLSYNEHVVTLTVTFHADTIAIDSVIVKVGIPNGLTLYTLEKDNNSVLLTWSKSPINDFLYYQVYRTEAEGIGYNSTLIQTIEFQDDTTFRDTSVVIGKDYRYQVYVENQLGISTASNEQTIAMGNFIEYQGEIKKMIYDRERDYIYAIDFDNNQLLFINTLTKSIEKQLAVAQEPVDLDIDANGEFLYVACTGTINSRKISKVDLNLQQVETNLTIPYWPSSIECGLPNRLLITTPYSGIQMALIDAESGSAIATSWISVDDPDIEIASDGITLYSGDSGTSYARLTKWNISNDTIIRIYLSTEIEFHPKKSLILNNNEDFMYYAGKKRGVFNINAIYGNFSDDIYALSANGEIAVGTSGIYNTSSYNMMEQLSFSSTVMAISRDNKNLYLFDKDRFRVYILNLNQQ
jgi:hypothetical protein